MSRPASFRLPFATKLLVCVAVVAVMASGSPVLGQDPRFGRGPNDPIALARAQRDALQAQIAAQQVHLADLTAASAQLSTALAQTTESLNGIMLDLGALRTQIEQTVAQLIDAETRRDDLQAQVESLDFTLKVLAEQADELSADLDSRRRELGARLADAWRATAPTLLEQVFSASSFMDGIVRQQGNLALSAHDLEIAESIQRDQALLDEQRLELQHMRYDTHQLHTQVAAAADQIALERDQLLVSQTTLAALEAQTAELQAQQSTQYAQVLQNKERVAGILAQGQAADTELGKHINALLQKERHLGRLPSKFNGTLRWPLIAPISQEFGCTGFILEPAYLTCPHFHRGIDIVAPYGAPIVAAGDGVVLFVGWDPGAPKKDAAYVVIIAHSPELISIYAHLQPRGPHRIARGIRVPTIIQGGSVHAGQVIGFEGNTGNSTGAHLHWALQLKGEPVNPRYFL
jgi:murein DD-endopeptidase MepM/ murein hydrolase activator NlpD